MAGFNLPITQYTPQQLADMARAAFKPPAVMNVSGLGGGVGGGGGGGTMQLPQSQGFNMGQHTAGMAPGLGALAGYLGKGPDLNARTAASDAEIADWVQNYQGTPAGRASLDAMTTLPQPTLAASYGGPMADGGPVTPGKYYTVGEQGPETFVPSVPGRIVPSWEGARTIPDPAAPAWGDARTIPDPADWATSKQRPMDWERDFFGGRKLRR